MPITWNQLRTPPERWTVTAVPRRLARLTADPWAGYWSSSQEVSDVAVRAVEAL